MTALLVHAVVVVAALGIAQDAVPPEDEPKATPIAQDGTRGAGTHGTRDSRWRMEVAPPADFYPQYIADPIRAQSALTILGVLDSDIPDTGDARFGLRLGGRFPMVRYHPVSNREIGWQLDFEGGFSGHFDVDYSLDVIGWDGFFGLQLSWKPRHDLGFRFGTLHDSAHVGDEYAERTGRRRIGYTREELILGVSWTPTARWRVYGEGGYGYNVKNFQEPVRLQAGVEYMGRRTFFERRMSWYAAVDLRAYEEGEWCPRTTAQIGLILPFGRRSARYRFAVEYAHGRSVLGEFFQHDESYLGVGWYFDF